GIELALQLQRFRGSVGGADAGPPAHLPLEATASARKTKLPAAPAFGLAKMVQAVPFQCWVRVWYTLLDRANPAAQTSVDDSAVTDSSSLMSLPTLGLGTTVQIEVAPAADPALARATTAASDSAIHIREPSFITALLGNGRRRKYGRTRPRASLGGGAANPSGSFGASAGAGGAGDIRDVLPH